MTDEEFDAFVAGAVDELEVKQGELRDTHGLGSQARFWVDQTQGTLDFIDAGGVTRTRAAILPVGSWSAGSRTWKWAWANESIHPALRERSGVVRELARLTGRSFFEAAVLSADEEMAWELTAMAVRHLGAIGAYRAPGSGANLFLAITGWRDVGAAGGVS